MSATRELPVRASLENLRKQAKALHRAFQDGAVEAVERVRANLPRINELPPADAAAAELSRQEAQHVLAKEYGYPTWEDLRAVAEASHRQVPFDAVDEMPPAALQMLFRATERDDWLQALSTARERTREAVYSATMTRDAVRAFTDAMSESSFAPEEVDAARERILATAQQLADEGRFEWPPQPEPGAFEDLARLPDRQMQSLLRQVSQKDLCRALVGAPDGVRGRALSNMSRRVRNHLVAESEQMAPNLPAHEPGASRQRLLEQARAQGRDGRTQWPPPADRPAWTGDLAALVPSATFDDLARLSDREVQAVLREASQADLCRALVGASEALWGKVLSNMSQRVRTFVTEESERLDGNLPAHEPAASRQRLLEVADTLSRDRRIAWPPAPGQPAGSGQVREAPSPPQDPLGGLSFEELSVDELEKVFGELASLAKAEGILALEEMAGGSGALGEGLRLAVDGTAPEVIETILDTRTETMIRNRRVRQRMLMEGVAALHAGDNPWIVFHRVQVFYLDSGVAEPPQRSHEDITAVQLRDWLERGWLGHRTPAQVAELLLHMAFIARREGLAALGELGELGEALEQPQLQQALALVIETKDWDHVEREMAPRLEEEVAQLASRLRGATAGMLGIARKQAPSQVKAAVRAAATG